ncbi:hypothetical protein ACWCYY_03455 [Kitasatospora sp. NPDC001664]
MDANSAATPRRPHGRRVGATWIADLALALDALDVDPSDTARTARIAALLGLRTPQPLRTVPGPRSPSPVTDRAPLPPAAPPSDPPAPVIPDDPPATSSPPPPPTPGREPLQLLLPLAETRALPMKPVGPPLPAEPPREATAPRPKPSLLPPRSELATLQTVLSRVVPEGRVDTDRLLEMLTTGQPMHTLPRHPVRTLRFGVQILADLDTGMQLFGEDQQMLIAKVRAIAGSHATEVLYFADSPLHRTGPGPGWTWRHYRPPAPGTQVLVLSNFAAHLPGGRTPAALRDEWRRICVMLRRGNCRPTALVPLPPARWPSWLTHLMPVLAWDRSTSAPGSASHPMSP